ncbi:capsule biosynthesis protein [Frigidibacter sp. MR17.24]|uniref:capsule biosynthesis protein n=1 Tax=Frigidibacter sp. MR17.24 TaxID=3127345 RepID=UPI00301316C2
MLQGHPSPFWGELADGLAAAGARVVKVHLCAADPLFWGRRAGISFRGRLRDWPGFVGDLCAREGVTDMLYFADRLPYHAAAQAEGARRGIDCWAIEFGYLRPDWLTLERDGMGARSHFPRDPALLRAMARLWPEPDMKVRHRHGFAQEAALEVGFNLAMVFGRPAFPFYRADKRYWPVAEYLGWIPVLLRAGREARAAAALEARARGGGFDYNLVAMQMQGDYQIRESSPYRDLTEFLREVMGSFARHAPAGRQLVIKLHPLESDLPRWGTRIPRLAAEAGLRGRVQVIRGGDLQALLTHSRGVVMVNSTVGLHALRLGVPVCARGSAVFRVPGLTHESGLDGFWTAPAPVDAALFAAFRRVLGSIQVKGSFFAPEGRRVAVAEMVRRLTDPARRPI